MINEKHEFKKLDVWTDFILKHKLTQLQEQQFAEYLSLLVHHNELFNLTAIVDTADIIAYHFQDSLAATAFVDFKQIAMIADVGSGGGFPGIPLKIMFPHLKLILIEVAYKKVDFLNTVITTLALQKARVEPLDWRTFLRKTDEPVELFIARASLHTDELIRMFKPNCLYKDRQLLYWASKDWHIEPEEKPFFVKEEAYTIKNKHRRLIFFARH